MQEIQEWEIVEIFEDNDSVVPKYKKVPIMKPNPICCENTPNWVDILNTTTSFTYNMWCSTDTTDVYATYVYNWNDTTPSYSNHTTSARHWR